MTTDNGARNDVQQTITTRPADVDFDQYRVPQGSVFFELYAPRKNNSTQGNYYSDIGVKFYQGGQLNLGAMSPSGASGGPPYPVWQIAITASKFAGGTTPNPNDIATRVASNSHPDLTNFDPVPTAGTVAGYCTVSSTRLLHSGTRDDRAISLVHQHDPGSNPNANAIY